MTVRIPAAARPYAIVIGLDCITGLQTARILAERKVPVIGIAENRDHFCCRTNVCEHVVTADIAGVELIKILKALGPLLTQKAVLIPCTDMSVLALSRHRAELQEWYHAALPEAQAVEMLLNKVAFYTYAQEAGLPIPGTVFLHSRADVERAAQELRFPCILKPPVKTPKWEENTKAKVYKIGDPAELFAMYNRCHTWADMLMAQEWIEGSDANLYSCNCYFDADAEPLVTFVARKLRQWPPETGTSCLGEECRNDTVLEETVRLFKNVDFHGLGYVEMKRDERTGKQYIIEPNIGRPTGRSAIAEAGGVELLYTMYCDLVGEPLPENRTQHYTNVKWIYVRRDVQSAFYYWRRGDLTLQQWIRSLHGRKGYAVWSWRDPAPFVGDIWQSAATFVTGMREQHVRRIATRISST